MEDATVEKFINQVMERGKKTIARKIVYGAFDLIKTQSKKDPVEVFQKAIGNSSPLVQVRSRRVGGATYQVPMEVKPEKQVSLAMKWILAAAKSKKGKPMKVKLADELLAASKNEGSAVKKKEDMHRMAEANRAFAHFAH
ncbi:MAG: 30S ribosomal protein S7 [Candidatus Wildermuthbacteria bacterium]|nr:30S ribosomal protein S7 [Candidatus Wildermuthbacteria bacterium]